MKNKKNKTKIFVGIEIVLVLAILFYLYFFANPTAYVISGESILDPDFVFEIEEDEEVWISSNEEFTNSIILKQDSEIQLPAGTYYWKIKNLLRESEVQTFTIESSVGLNLYNRGENYELENSGNVDLEVSGENSGITGSLGVGDSIEVMEEDIYEGKQE